VWHTSEHLVESDAASRLTAPGGRVSLDIPDRAVTQRARFTYRSVAARRLREAGPGPVLQFELTARPADAGEDAPPITRFEKPIRLTVDLTGLMDLAALGPHLKTICYNHGTGVD
jgi:hypothetical protein